MSASATASFSTAVAAQQRLNDRLSYYGVECRVDATPVPSSSSSSSTHIIHSTSSHNRTLHASRDFAAGEVILRSTPHSFVLTPLPETNLDDDDGDDRTDSAASKISARARCEWCGCSRGDLSLSTSQPFSKLLRCSQCHIVHYCSTSCQRSAWKEFHSFECKSLWSKKEKVLTLDRLAPEAKMDLVLLGRCVRKKRKVEEMSEEKRGKEENDMIKLERERNMPLHSTQSDLNAVESHFSYLSSVLDEHSANSKAAVTKKGSAATPASSSTPSSTISSASSDESLVLSIAQRMTDNTQLLSIGFRLGLFGPSIAPDHVSSVLLPLLTSFQSNNFAITNGLLITQGAGVYPLGALLNHSCAPNCVIGYESMKSQHDEKVMYHHIQTIRTIVPVKKGDELTHSYIDTLGTLSSRRQKLKERYYFHCLCPRCSADELGENDASRFELFWEKDADGMELPKDILEYQEGEEAAANNPGATDGKTNKAAAPSSSTSTSTTSTASPSHIALRRANTLFLQATSIHMAPNTSSPDEYEAEEQRRNRQEQLLISTALSIRAQFLHPYHIHLLSTYSSLNHIALLNQDYLVAIQACEQLCSKYRIVYGSEEVRRKELGKVKERRIKDQERERTAEGKQQLNREENKDKKIDINNLQFDDDSDDDDNDPSSTLPISSYTDLPSHPILGLQLYTLAALYAQDHQHALSKSTFNAALKILRVTHGADHELTRKLVKELQDVEEEEKKKGKKSATNGTTKSMIKQ